MNILILWNKTPFASLLEKEFGYENVITEKEDFEVVLKEIDNYQSIIVLCELNWSLHNKQENLQELKGIELIKELRRTKDIKQPVLFVSFLTLKSIINAEREIVTAIGHSFLQLPITPQLLASHIIQEFGDEKGNIQQLSVMELTDIKSFYCSKEGILSHELHALSSSNTAEEFIAVIRRIHDLFLENSLAVVTQFQKKFPEQPKEKTIEWIKEIGNNLLERYNGISTSNDENLSKNIKYPWKVLFLDDEIAENHELIQCMKSNGLEVICVANAQAAKLVLLNDWQTENRIMVVIADYRLYETIDGIKRHQKTQGYEFLKEISSTDHLVRLVAFSGLARKFLLNSFKHYNIRTQVMSKIDYLKAPQLFCDEIIDLAEENWEAIESLPNKCAGFDKTLKATYIEFRQHPDYNKMESNISLIAKEYVLEIQEQINNTEEIRIGAIENIKSPLAKTKKDIEAYFNRFQNYLIARRIAMWLYATNKKGLHVNIDSRKIAEILTDQKYPTDAYRQILSTNLGLSLDDFPRNITIEERRWLQYEMGLNIFRDIHLMIPIYSKIANIYTDFILKNEYFKEQIRKGKFIVTYKYKQTNYILDFSKDFIPDIKTASDVRVLFLWIAEQVKRVKEISEFKSMISKLRLALFESRNEVIYLKNLFEYFNNYYRILNNEQSNLSNAPSKIKDKSEYSNKSNAALNKSYERVYELLLNDQLPIDTDTADTWKLLINGENIIEKFGKKLLEDKAKFFSEMTKHINEENGFISKNSLDEGRISDSEEDFFEFEYCK